MVQHIKAALISFFIVTLDQIAVCNPKGIAHTDEPTENYNQTPQPAQNSIESSCFGVFSGRNFTVLNLPPCSEHWCLQQLCSEKNSLSHCALAAHHQMDKISGRCLGIGGEQTREADWI